MNTCVRGYRFISYIYNLWNLVLPRVCRILCWTWFAAQSFFRPSALDVKINMYGYAWASLTHVWICMGEPHACMDMHGLASCAAKPCVSQLELDEEDRKPWKRQGLEPDLCTCLTVAVEDANAGLFKGR